LQRLTLMDVAIEIPDRLFFTDGTSASLRSSDELASLSSVFPATGIRDSFRETKSAQSVSSVQHHPVLDPSQIGWQFAVCQPFIFIRDEV